MTIETLEKLAFNYFNENVSGEPLTQDAVIEAMARFSASIVNNILTNEVINIEKITDIMRDYINHTIKCKQCGKYVADTGVGICNDCFNIEPENK